MTASSRNASFICLVSFLVILALTDCRAAVINVGDSFTIECSQEKRGKFEYDPTLDFMAPNSERWDTLFTGGQPRPETNVAQWNLESRESDPKVFVYTLLSATPANGGQYKCDNIEDIFVDLTVVDPDSMECPKLPDELNIGETIDPKCSLQKSGPADLNIKWYFRGDEVDGGNDGDGTFDRASSKLEMALEQSHNGQDLVCQYEDANGEAHAKCSLSLNVLIPVGLGSIKHRAVEESSADGNEVLGGKAGKKVVCEIQLRGNPPPNADEIDIRPDGIVEKLETRRNKDGSLVVEITYTSPEEDTYLNFTYAGEFLNNIVLPLNSAEAEEVDGEEGGSTGAAVAIGCVCGLFLLVIIGAFLVLYLRTQQQKKKEEDDTEEKPKDLASVEEGETPKDALLQNSSPEQVEQTEEKEEQTKIVDEEKQVRSEQRCVQYM